MKSPHEISDKLLDEWMQAVEDGTRKADGQNFYFYLNRAVRLSYELGVRDAAVYWDHTAQEVSQMLRAYNGQKRTGA